MRVLFCKINCPFFCFCKPSAARLYTSGPLELENGKTNHVVAAPTAAASSFAVPDDEKSSSCSGVIKEDHQGVNGNGNGNGNHEQSADNVLKSCIRKDLSPGPHESAKEIEKKRVQWVDNIGKELAAIKEFEASETGDTDNEEESSRCLCVIL